MSTTTRPSPAQQKTVLRDVLEKEDLKENETWYLISARWYKIWKDHVKFGEEEASVSADTPPPQPIDNSDLIEEVKKSKKSKDEFVALREDLSEEYDYFVFSEKVWNLLFQWYGGGPVIPRKTIVIGEGSSQKIVVETYPLTLKSFKNKDNSIDTSSESEIVTSRKATVKQLKQVLCKKYQVEDPEKARVWNIFASPKLIEDESQTLEEATIANEQRILLEIQSPTGTWTTFEDEPPKKHKKKSFFHFLGFGSSSSEPSPPSTQVSSGKLGLCGLSNLGNTCFMNSALQCLSNTVPLTDYFLSGKYKNEINKTNPLGMKGKIAEEYGSLLKQMWSPSSAGSAVAPRNFKLTIGKYAPQFSGYNQNDSQELLAFLLDGLHEDLNRITKKQFVEMKEENNIPDEELAKIFWDNHLKRDQSIIVDLFQGQLKSRIVCPQCANVSVCFDPFMYLSLPLPMEKETMLDVIVVKYCEPWELPLKYAVKVDKGAKIEELKETVAKISNSKRLVLADLYNSKLYAFLTESKPISTIRPNDVTLAYQVPDDVDPDATQITILHRRVKKESSSQELFGIPILMWIDKVTTAKDLYQNVWNRIKFFVKNSETGNFPEISFEENFKICYVNANGTSCGKCSKMMCNGCVLKCKEVPVEVKSGSTFCVDWDAKYYKKHFNAESASLVRVDESVNEARKSLNKTMSLRDCLQLFTTDEKLSANDTWYCKKCKEHLRANKKFDLWKVPQILVIHLKRFQYSRWSRDKLSTTVEFPLEGLDLSEFVLSKSEKSPVYDLFAVSHHSGGLGGGHYTAYAKNRDDKWYLFNDSSCSLVETQSNIQTSGAYVLFYKRRE